MMLLLLIEKNLLIYSLDNNKFTKKNVSYFIFSKFTPQTVNSYVICPLRFSFSYF